MSKIINDKPIKDSRDDILGFDVFANNIVNMLNIIPKDESFNFALCGKWGSGKTSIMNLAVENIEENNLFNVVHFNPWNVIKKENLITEFFELLKKTIYVETLNKKILTQFSKYYTVLVDSIPDESFFQKFIKNFTSRFVDSTDTIKVRKEKIINFLKNEYCGKPILFVIDDLDRLTNEEICEVLKLIREIADFQNVIYFVLFEREQVVNAIEKELNINSGDEYLKKFFQIEWMVPVLEKEKIKSYLLRLLQENNLCYEKINSEMLDYYDIIFEKCICEFVKNIRDIKLLYNSFYSRFSLLHKWVNFVDLLAITCFELYKPNLYNFIMEKKQSLIYFCELSTFKSPRNKSLNVEDEINDFIQDLFSSYFEKEEFDTIKTILFRTYIY